MSTVLARRSPPLRPPGADPAPRFSERARQAQHDAVFAPRAAGLSSNLTGPGGALSPQLEASLRPLVQALVEGNGERAHSNPFSALDAFFAPPTEPMHGRVVQSLRLAHDHDTYPYLQARVSGTRGGMPSETQVQLRSNGRAAFIDRSYQALQNHGLQKFRFAYQGPGFVGTEDQASFLLRSLPENAELARVMDPAEFEVWKRGEPWKLDSGFVGGGTHLGLGDFSFRHRAPYRFTVPRAVLERLHAHGHLVVNSYEDAALSPRGMGASARTPFGLEMELVALGEGRRLLQPFIARAAAP